MIPNRIEGATHRLGKPQGWEGDEERGCAHLWIRKDGDVFMSSWEPTPKELEILKAGGSIRLSIVGGQPPVMLDVMPPFSEDGSTPPRDTQ